MKIQTSCLILSLLSLGTLIVFLYTSLNKVDEGYTTYASCRAEGISEELCQPTPVTVWGSAGCLCHDGHIGVIHDSLRGECLCSRYF